VTPYNPQVHEMLQRSEELLQAAGPPAPVVASPSPIALLYGEVQRQSAMQAILDDFWLMGVLMAVLILGLLLLRKPRHAAPMSPGH